MADPFAGVLERSAAAQAVRDARASLSRPLRPFTPASRSLFEGAGSPGRSASGRALGALKLTRDAFGFDRAKDSMASTRSSFGLGPIIQVIPELEEPEMTLADVLEQGQAGVIIREGHTEERVFSPETRRKPESAAAVAFGRFNAGPDEEYEGGGAEDLALCMEVPPGSDDSCSEDEGQPQSYRRAAAPSSAEGAAVGTSGGHQEDSPQALLADLRAPALAQRSPDDLLEHLGGITDRLLRLVGAREDGGPSATDTFKASLALLERTLKLSTLEASHVPLVRICGCLLRQLRCSSTRMELQPRAVAATTLNVAKTLFKLSKDAGLDADFRHHGCLELLVEELRDPSAGPQQNDCQVLIAGILKNTSNDDANQQHMLGLGILHVLDGLLRSGDEQLLVQITALLRNLLSTSEHHEEFLASGCLKQLTAAMAQYRNARELQVNIARVLSKLSGFDDTCESMLEHMDQLLEAICRSMSDHSGVSALVTRHAFVLGSFTAIDEDIRERFAGELGGIELLVSLLDKYWQQDRRLGQLEAEANKAIDPAADSEFEEVLVKLVRLVANLTISQEAGRTLASSASVVDILLGILEGKRIADSEELVLNTLAAVTNLTFHESEENLLLSAENKRLLCKLMQPMLLESYNVEALVECARALGNMSRHEDVRQCVVELRIDEVLSILLSHHDRDLVFYSCGAFVNLASDIEAARQLRQGRNLPKKLADILRDISEDDTRMMLVAAKVLANLHLDQPDVGDFGPEEQQALQASLQRAIEVQEVSSAEEDGERKALLQLLHQLSSSLPSLA